MGDFENGTSLNSLDVVMLEIEMGTLHVGAFINDKYVRRKDIEVVRINSSHSS